MITRFDPSLRRFSYIGQAYYTTF